MNFCDSNLTPLEKAKNIMKTRLTLRLKSSLIHRTRCATSDQKDHQLFPSKTKKEKVMAPELHASSSTRAKAEEEKS